MHIGPLPPATSRPSWSPTPPVLRFVNLERNEAGLVDLDCDRDDFTTALATIVLRHGALLFNDLRSASALLEDEWLLFSNALTRPSCLVYSRAHLASEM